MDPELQERILAALVEMSENMEETAQSATNRAFNLGCAVGLLPAILMIIGTYFIAGKSWLGVVVMIVLMLLGLVLFANLAASISRRNTLMRVFRQDIQPQIATLADKWMLDVERIRMIGIENLHEGSPLKDLLLNNLEAKASSSSL